MKGNEEKMRGIVHDLISIGISLPHPVAEPQSTGWHSYPNGWSKRIVAMSCSIWNSLRMRIIEGVPCVPASTRSGFRPTFGEPMRS
jgi:hypothetical protein